MHPRCKEYVLWITVGQRQPHEQLNNWNGTHHWPINSPFSLVIHLKNFLLASNLKLTTSLQLTWFIDLLGWALTKPANEGFSEILSTPQPISNDPLGTVLWEQPPNSSIIGRASKALSKPSSSLESRWFISWETSVNGPYFSHTMKKNEGHPYIHFYVFRGKKMMKGLPYEERLKELGDKYRGK